MERVFDVLPLAAAALARDGTGGGSPPRPFPENADHAGEAMRPAVLLHADLDPVSRTGPRNEYHPSAGPADPPSLISQGFNVDIKRPGRLQSGHGKPLSEKAKAEII